MGPLRDTLDTVNQEYDICVLGPEGSGKSAVIMHYIYHRFIPDTDSELEGLYTKVIRDGSSYNEITILDTGSRLDNYASSRKKQLANSSAMMFAYSITDENSFYSIQDTFERVNRHRDTMPPCVLMGLKADMEEERKVSYEEGEAFAQEIGALEYFECSAALGVNIDEAFQPLVKIILETKKSQRRPSNMKQFDITSLQSLKEVLSSPSPSETPAWSESPNMSMTNSKKLDFESIENLEIPKFISNSFATQAATKAQEEVVSPSNTAAPVVSNHTTKSSPKRYTKEDVEILEKRVKNHKKARSGCCVIV